MKRYGITATLGLVLLTSGIPAAAALEVPELQGRVTDLAGVLSPEQARTLEARLRSYAEETGHQFAVLLVPSLQGDPIEDFSIRVAEAWKLGDKARDDGLLFVVAVEDRKMRIEVGYGLEGAVTDLTAGRIIREIVAPRFRQEDYAGGVQAGVAALMRVAEGEALGPPPKGSSKGSKRGRSTLLNLIAFVIIMPMLLLGRLFGRRRRGGGMLMGALVGSQLAGRGFSGGGGFGGGFGGGGGGGFGGGGASGGW